MFGRGVTRAPVGGASVVMYVNVNSVANEKHHAAPTLWYISIWIAYSFRRLVRTPADHFCDFVLFHAFRSSSHLVSYAKQ